MLKEDVYSLTLFAQDHLGDKPRTGNSKNLSEKSCVLHLSLQKSLIAQSKHRRRPPPRYLKVSPSASCLPAPGRLKKPLDVTSLLYHILWLPTQLRDEAKSSITPSSSAPDDIPRLHEGLFHVFCSAPPPWGICPGICSPGEDSGGWGHLPQAE